MRSVVEGVSVPFQIRVEGLRYTSTGRVNAGSLLSKRVSDGLEDGFFVGLA